MLCRSRGLDETILRYLQVTRSLPQQRGFPPPACSCYTYTRKRCVNVDKHYVLGIVIIVFCSLFHVVAKLGRANALKQSKEKPALSSKISHAVLTFAVHPIFPSLLDSGLLLLMGAFKHMIVLYLIMECEHDTQSYIFGRARRRKDLRGISGKRSRNSVSRFLRSSQGETLASRMEDSLDRGTRSQLFVKFCISTFVQVLCTTELSIRYQLSMLQI